MNLITTATELLNISQLLRRYSYDRDYDNGDLYDFDQVWGSTALGFDGVGGSAMTTARTYVFVPGGLNTALVFFRDRFAYQIDNPNEQFWEDVQNHNMASVRESGRYES